MLFIVIWIEWKQLLLYVFHYVGIQIYEYFVMLFLTSSNPLETKAILVDQLKR